MAWHIGLNAGSMWMGLLGLLVAMVGIMLPSATLTYFAAQWGHRNRNLRAVRALKLGMAPIVVALLISTGWVLVSANSKTVSDSP